MRRKSIFSKASIENSECSLDIISAVTAILTRYADVWTANRADHGILHRRRLPAYAQPEKIFDPACRLRSDFTAVLLSNGIW